MSSYDQNGTRRNAPSPYDDDDLLRDFHVELPLAESPAYYVSLKRPPTMSDFYPDNTPSTPVATGDLLGDFELVESSAFLDRPSGTNTSTSSSGSDELLIDISNKPNHKVVPTINKPERRNTVVALLQKRVAGWRFDKRHGEFKSRIIELVPGMMLRPMEDDNWMKNEIENAERESNNRPRFMTVAMEAIENGSTCAMVTSSDVMKISDDQALLLLSVDVDKRLDIYHNIERLHFLENLCVGRDVAVEFRGIMYPARVSWIGERPDEHGTWYGVDFYPDSPPTHDQLRRSFHSNFNSADSMSHSSVNSRTFFSPSQMHMPLKGGGVAALYDNRRPVALRYEKNKDVSPPKLKERIVPVAVRREEVIQAPSKRSTPPQHESRQTRHVPSMDDYPPPRYEKSDGRASQTMPVSHPRPLSPPQTPPSSVSSQHPSRSKSVHSLSKRTQLADRNEPVKYDEQSGARIGEPCVWQNNGKDERGTIKYLGYLKGHATLYAGIEFNNKIGAGTGIFAGDQLFNARDGHAGFVEITSLIVLPSSAKHRRRLSSSRSQQIPFNPTHRDIPASAGATVSVPVNGTRQKQASIESLSDPAPPPYTPPSPPRSSSAAAGAPPIPPKPSTHIEDYLIDSYDVGSQVMVCHLGAQRSGVVRWVGDATDEEGERLEKSAVVQLDEDVPTAWRRSHEVSSYIGPTVPGGVLVPMNALRRSRAVSASSNIPYSSIAPTSSTSSNYLPGSARSDDFGSIDSGVEKQKCVPAKELSFLVGRQKGIQGYYNSCYLDATLYAMFAQSSVFDFLLEKSMKKDDRLAAQFQKVLAQEIVYPLRKFHYVRADHVMNLRRILAQLLPHVSGLTSEEKDPEEILAHIFERVFHAEPFIRLVGADNKTDSQFLCPIVVDGEWNGGAATSQHLLERHLRAANVKFQQAPNVLIMQLPRYGQQKVFDKILPLERIDITPFVIGAVPPCSQCGECADTYCPTCFLTRRVFFTDVVYCLGCFKRTHMSPELVDHRPRELFPPGKPPKKPSSHKMVLSAVLCIETSHYVAYVRSQTGQWLFFDSMADREGLSDGFNVPVVRECPDVSAWLSPTGWQRLKEADETGQLRAMCGKGSLDPLVNRLLSDSYICFYENASNHSSSGMSIMSTFKSLLN